MFVLLGDEAEKDEKGVSCGLWSSSRLVGAVFLVGMCELRKQDIMLVGRGYS